MPNVIVDKQTIDILANAISAKSGEPVTMTLDEMVEAVDGIDMGITPTGNIDITSAGTTDVTQYATATVPEASFFVSPMDGQEFFSEGGIRKWRYRSNVEIDPNSGDNAGWIDEGVYQSEYLTRNAVPSGTTVTPSKTAQTVGGANYMMEGPVTVSAVPMADAGPAGGTETFITESGVRKFRYEYEAYAESEGWVDEGGLGNPTWVEWTAVPSNTTVTPTESAQTVGGTKQMMEGAVTVSAIPSNYVGSGVTRRSSTDLTASGATVTAPAGYYSSAATKTVASGTEGTPTATKGTVSNNSVSVTPSVTNTAGYVSGGTHTGTAVTVTASELVSGSQTITQNGTVDVTNLEEVVVAVSGGGGQRTTIVPEQTVTVSGYYASLTYVAPLVVGETYIYTINGNENTGNAVSRYGSIYLGNSTTGYFEFYNNQMYLNLEDTSLSPGTYTVKIEQESGGGGGSTLIEKSITANGTYNASDDDADGYSKVTVNVSGGSVNIGTVTTTNSSNQNTSISFTLPSGRTPKAFFCRLTSQIARNSNSRYYYVYDMRWDGSSTGGVAGNTFYMYNGTLTNVTSGYSYSQSNTTFTLSSTGSWSASPGSFFNGTYELVYVY